MKGSETNGQTINLKIKIHESQIIYLKLHMLKKKELCDLERENVSVNSFEEQQQHQNLE